MSSNPRDAVLGHIQEQRETVIDLQRNLTAIPALGPDNDGQGEMDKAIYVREVLNAMGLTDIYEFPAPDTRVACGFRPNLAVRIPGEDTSRTLWVISHLDIVPPGEASLWNSDPYTLKVDGDLIYGRGVQDNQQGMVSSLLAARAFLETGVKPRYNLGLLFVADEETGSIYGLDYVVRNHRNFFARDDLFLIPDFGNPESTLVDVSEKSIFWLKMMVKGKQCHGSRPASGINSFLGVCAFVMKLRRLYEDFPARNPIFFPPFSTFEATKKEANVPNVNTIPGFDVFYMDCRIMPDYSPDEVMEKIMAYGREIESEYGVGIDYEVVQDTRSAPPTPENSEIVVSLLKSIRRVYGAEAVPTGIGGGTVAAVLRREGFQAAVWATLFDSMHQPNEYASIANIINDAKVIADMLVERTV